MEKDFEAFDRKGLSGEERLRVIINKYGKQPRMPSARFGG